MTTERNARREARNRLMSPGIGLLFDGPGLNDLSPSGGDRDGETGIVAYLRGMKQLFASNVPVGF